MTLMNFVKLDAYRSDNKHLIIKKEQGYYKNNDDLFNFSVSDMF